MFNTFFNDVEVFLKNKMKMAQIIINKATVNERTIVGNNVTLLNGKVYIDGKLINVEEKTINISIEGNCENISADHCNKIEVTGNANKITTSMGDVTVRGNVSGNVEASSGDIYCGDVTGNVETSMGDINCKNVGGKVSTSMGDINCTR